MQEFNEIKLGGLHYKKLKQGFWINQKNVDPHSKTVTESELIHILEASILKGRDLCKNVEQRILEAKSIIKQLKKQRRI